MPNQANNKKAVALKYSQNEMLNQKPSLKTSSPQAPTIVAKGEGDIADQIIELAKQNGVLIHKDTELNDILSKLDLGQEIPESLYHVIAELISFSYLLQGKFPENWNNVHDKIDFKE